MQKGALEMFKMPRLGPHGSGLHCQQGYVWYLHTKTQDGLMCQFSSASLCLLQNCRASSWDRSCPIFQAKCNELNDQLEENKLQYFPTDETWTQVREPPKVVYVVPPLVLPQLQAGSFFKLIISGSIKMLKMCKYS